MSGREKRRAPGIQKEERPGDRQMLSLSPQQALPRLLDSSFWSLYPPVLFPGRWQTSTTPESPFASESQLTWGKVSHEAQESESPDKFIANA